MTTARPPKESSQRNRTLIISKEKRFCLLSKLIIILSNRPVTSPITGTIQGDCYDWANKLPPNHLDLLFLVPDPPYDLDKSFDGNKFSRQKGEDYTELLEEILVAMKPLLKPTSSSGRPQLFYKTS